MSALAELNWCLVLEIDVLLLFINLSVCKSPSRRRASNCRYSSGGRDVSPTASSFFKQPERRGQLNGSLGQLDADDGRGYRQY